ncbi:TRAP transporter small permease [Rhodococcus sp. NPDC057529]|uniref:TRAP transporter small permease n=1 Tax=Rhodococcus sp. NPDC057529 TaxID=3346158 RepID=UPI00366CE0EB
MAEPSSAIAGKANRFLRVIEIPAVIVLVVMMLHVTANAILRTVAGSPIQNTIEIVEYVYMPILALLGFVAAQARGEHIVADIATTHMAVRTRRVVLCAGYLLTAVVTAGFAWYGMHEAVHAYEITKTAGVSDVPAWPVYFLVPTAFAVMTVLLVGSAYRAIRGVEDDEVSDTPIYIDHTSEEIQ